MTTSTKGILALIGAVIIGVAIWGAYQYPKALVSIGSPVGTTFGTAKVAQINISPATLAATSTGIVNTDASDRYITDGFAACGGVGTSYTITTGTGLAAWTVTMSTTSSASVNSSTNTNYVFNTNLATGTADLLTVGTTTGTTNSFKTRWASGSTLAISFNATNTAACTAGVHYLGS